MYVHMGHPDIGQIFNITSMIPLKIPVAIILD